MGFSSRIDEFLKYLAGIIEVGGEILSARDMVNVISEKEAVIYSEMEDAYAASKNASVQPVVSSMGHR